MKKPTLQIIFLVLSAAMCGAESAHNLQVHEWGTFTTVHASDGTLMGGLEIEEEILPPFVYSHAGMEPDRLTSPGFNTARKGYFRLLQNVTVKMETPVLYFYTKEALKASVEVGFRGGSISQWYPQRSGGETAPSGSIDFSTPFSGSIKWDFDILAPGATQPYSPQPTWQPTHWPIARVPQANKVKSENGEVESFLFYRGIGNFDLPLHITANAQTGLHLTNQGNVTIPYLLVYGRLHYGIPRIWWQGPLQAGATQEVTKPGSWDPGNDLSEIFDLFRTQLTKAGLNEAEGSAMLNTWKESYFMREGLRVFWITPRSFTDKVLPIKITPTPQQLERVMVGRSEVLLHEFEAFLVREYQRNQLAAFSDDRYRKAYAQRVKKLSEALPGKPADSPQPRQGN